MAAEEFTRRGYHSTRVEHIAERLAVTPGALYRHVPGKYEMFRDAVATLAAALESASECVPAGDGSPASLDQIVESITRTTWGHRPRAALYRWQARYLSPEDRAAVGELDARVRRRLADAIRKRRRLHDRDPRGAGSAAAAILSCIASLGHHRIGLTEDDAVALMTSIAADLALTDPASRAGRHPLSGPATDPTRDPARGLSIRAGEATPDGTAAGRLRGGAATREGALTAAIARFHSSGYDSVTMEAIGADVGVGASALYRHFPGKSALLTAAVDRTASFVERLLDGDGSLRTSGADSATALAAVLRAYVSIAFSHGPDLMLYHSELGSIDKADRQRIRIAQRRQLQRWADLVVATGGDAITCSPAGFRFSVDADSVARTRVHAALAVVLDGGQGTGFHPAAADRFSQLAGRVLMPRAAS